MLGAACRKLHAAPFCTYWTKRNQKYKENIAKIENNVYNGIPHHKMR